MPYVAATSMDQNTDQISLEVPSEVGSNLVFHPEFVHGFVFEPLAKWAQIQPAKLAAISSSDRRTYAEFEAETNRIARCLRRNGVTRGDRVAFLVGRGIPALLLLTGILKAGAAYVPLDPESPRDRLRECLEDAQPTVCIYANEQLRDSVPCPGLAYLLDEFKKETDTESPEPIDLKETDLQPSDNAYIIFTSGTTGRPKGVPIHHEALTNFVKGDQEICVQVQPDDCVFQGFSPASDGHIEEIWPCFLAGATLVVASNHEVHSAADLSAILRENRVTIISCAPTLLSMVDEDIPTIRRILFGAEQCPPAMVQRWWKPGRTILNTYGPTEATVGATFGVCTPDSSITIGRPLPNYYCYVLNEALEEVADGEEGELCISGVGVSTGYFGRTELSVGRFVENPYFRPELHNERLYKTGDLVKRDTNGNLVWLGRVDGQIKIRGHRIEVTEIEGALMSYDSIQQAVVTLRKDSQDDSRLCSLLVLKEDAPFSVEELLNKLRNILPGYMIPQSFEEVDRIPVLPSGKVDRRSCGLLRGTPIRLEREIIPPTTENERHLLGLWQEVFPDAEISCVDDFFRDLGGHSLVASRFVSLLRRDPRFSGISVIDLYDNPTIRGLASLLDQRKGAAPQDIPFHEVPAWRYKKAKFVMGFGVLLLLAFNGAFWIGPLLAAIYFSDKGYNDLVSLALGLGVHMLSIPAALLWTVAVKWLVAGRLKEGSYPIWGTTFIRWWFVNRMMTASPITYLTGTPLAPLYLRLMGAKVGKNVTLESLEIDVPDLIEIGDDVVLENSAWLHCAEVAHGLLHLRRIQVGRGSALGVRSGLAGGAIMEEGSSLRDLSCLNKGQILPAFEEWAGSPAVPVAEPEMPRYDPALSPKLGRRFGFGLAQLLSLPVLAGLEFLPFMSVAWLLYNSTENQINYWFEPIYAIGLVFVACVQVLAIKWAVLGKLKPGTYAFPGFLSFRKWFTDKHLELLSSIIVPVYDSLFARPWCVALGMKCGPRCEIALPRRMPYDLVEMGQESFIASEVSVGRPIRRNGALKLEKTTIGIRTFLGNDSVAPQGVHVPDDFLLGVLSVCPDNEKMGADRNQAWLGSPAFKMPTRHVHGEFDIRQTYQPTKRMYAERLVHEAIRIVLPSIFLLIVAAILIEGFTSVWNNYSLEWAVAMFGPLYLGVMLLAAGLIRLCQKILIGRYRPTVQPLWSRFVWKTETYSAILHDFGAPLFIAMLQGSPFMGTFMRFVGARVGSRAYINTTDWTETDLISIGTDAAINSNAPLQAHLFEDRVIKVGPIVVGDRCTVGHYSVVLCDSTVRSDGHVGHLSLVMKGETIPSHTLWRGAPAQAHSSGHD